MTTETQAMLAQHVDNTAETIRALVQQIESGEYGDMWTVSDADGNTIAGEVEGVKATDEDDAISFVIDALGLPADSDLTAERIEADEPTVDETPISEWPLEIVDERGREFAVVLATGGPHIEVVADGLSSARLEGYWAGDRVTRHGDYLSTFLDYFIER